MMDVEEVPDGESPVPAKPEKQNSEAPQTEIDDGEQNGEENTEADRISPNDEIEDEKTSTENVSPLLDAGKPDVLDAEKPDVLDTEKPDVLDTEKPDVLDAEKPDVLDTEKPDVQQVDNDEGDITGGSERSKSPEERTITPVTVTDSSLANLDEPQESLSKDSESIPEESTEKGTEDSNEVVSVEEGSMEANLNESKDTKGKEVESSIDDCKEVESIEEDSNTANLNKAKDDSESVMEIKETEDITMPDKTETVQDENVMPNLNKAEEDTDSVTEIKESKDITKPDKNETFEDRKVMPLLESEAMEVEREKTPVIIDLDDANDSTTSKDVSEEKENVSAVAEETESMGLQISAVTGSTESTDSKSSHGDSSKTTDIDGKNGDVAMETEDGGDLKMIISEPHTVIPDTNEPEKGEKTLDEKGKKGEEMEVDGSESTEKSEAEAIKEGDPAEKSSESKEETPHKVENVLSENDGLGIKIVSVSAATESTETKKDDVTTIEDEDEKKKTEDDGPKIIETTSLSESPQRITRSRTGSIPAPTQHYTSPPFTASTKPQTQPAQPQQTCIVCHRIGKCKYNIVRNGDVKHLCNDKCFKEFRALPTRYLRGESAKVTNPPAAKMAVARASKYNTCTVCQLMDVNAATPFLNWSSLSFCGEECLGRYKKQMKSTCGQCSKIMPPSQRATFCLKVGADVKQFCNSDCYLKFKSKRKLKSCAYCKKDVTGDTEAFVAPSGINGEFLDFCSPVCMTKFEKDRDDVEIIRVDAPKVDVACAVCMKVTKPKHELTFEGKLHKMCSDPCYSAFQYANKLTSNTCDNCGVYCYGEGSSPQFIQFEGHQKRFCATKCVNAFRSANKKMIQCAWCGSRKSNFDMIERVDANNKYQLFCSLNCLSLYRVNLQATSNQSVTCDQCRKFVPAQYHLTMSDASVRNFCSYSCVMTFQGQFGAGSKSAQPTKKVAPNLVNPPPPITARPTATRASLDKLPTRSSTELTPNPTNKPSRSSTALTPNPTNKPSRSNRHSLPSRSKPIDMIDIEEAPVANNITNPTVVQRSQTVNIKSNTQVPVLVSNQQTVKTVSTGTQQRIIIQPPPPKQVKNKALLCKPYVQTKATSCRPSTQAKDTQTEFEEEKKPIFIPVPVPIFIPVPLAMYTCPAPVPLPIPVPIPIPYFIPTTKKSADAILKHIKEIRERIPDDPFQAELLRMADAVANAEKVGGDSDDDNMDESGDGSKLESGTDPQEDMLQMALRMASEISEPTDLEAAVNPLTIIPVKEAPSEEINEEEDERDEEYTPRQRRSRGRKAAKRQPSPRGSRRSKRQKVESDSDDNPEPEEETVSVPVAPPPAAPPATPDAAFLLKYMYGVNAWKHWVVQKNAQLEKVKRQGSGRVKLFQTDLLQCVADELNYSLCLFVKEVRKPNGEEYAADSILYLCFGIQNYLFENGRIDNIFTDIYYEKFTECLNEVVQRFKPKLNPAGQLVCRIEEEHLWECKQLGAHSPYVLLNTLVYFNTKEFLLKTPNDHMKLSFSHIVKHWKKLQGVISTNTSKAGGGKCFFLKYQVPAALKTGVDKKTVSLEQVENLDNPLRCPVKLYEFYLSKCSYFSSPEAIKARNDIFYLVPERSCVPDSPVWYSTQPMTVEPMAKMLNRIHLVKEVQLAFMNAGLS